MGGNVSVKCDWRWVHSQLANERQISGLQVWQIGGQMLMVAAVSRMLTISSLHKQGPGCKRPGTRCLQYSPARVEKTCKSRDRECVCVFSGYAAYRHQHGSKQIHSDGSLISQLTVPQHRGLCTNIHLRWSSFQEIPSLLQQIFKTHTYM